MTYKVMAGTNAGNTQSLGLAKTRRPKRGVGMAFSALTVARWLSSTTAEGDITMLAVSDAGEGVVVVTTPPNPFLPKGMQQGATRTYSQQVQ